MKIAVFSDIHGNYHAFKKCYEYALSRQIRTFIFLGDYLGEFAYPQKTIQLLYEIRSKYECYFVRGNKEDYWLNRRKNINCDWKNGNNSVYSMIYNFEHLADKDLDFFEQLPLVQRLPFENAPCILACHGSPKGNIEKMLPSNPNFTHIIDDCDVDYILCGHTHIQAEYFHNGKHLLNPGAVGVSFHSEGGKAQFMIMECCETAWEYEFVSLDYDRDEAIRELKEAGLYQKSPYWCQITEHLIYNGAVSHGEVLNKAYELCRKETDAYEWYNIPDKYWEMAIKVLYG